MGYLVSSDATFTFIQRLPEWGKRPRVHLRTRDLPRLTEFALGRRLNDDELVRIVFSPINMAAAEQMSDQIQRLARVGVDLRGAGMLKLEWDVTHGLRDSLLAHKKAEKDVDASDDARADSAVSLSQAAKREGYPLDKGIAEAIEKFEALRDKLKTEKGSEGGWQRRSQRSRRQCGRPDSEGPAPYAGASCTT